MTLEPLDGSLPPDPTDEEVEARKPKPPAPFTASPIAPTPRITHVGLFDGDRLIAKVAHNGYNPGVEVRVSDDYTIMAKRVDMRLPELHVSWVVSDEHLMRGGSLFDYLRGA